MRTAKCRILFPIFVFYAHFSSDFSRLRLAHARKLSSERSSKHSAQHFTHEHKLLLLTFKHARSTFTAEAETHCQQQGTKVKCFFFRRIRIFQVIFSILSSSCHVIHLIKQAGHTKYLPVEVCLSSSLSKLLYINQQMIHNYKLFWRTDSYLQPNIS